MLILVADDLGTDLLQRYEPDYPGTPTDPLPPPTPVIDRLTDEGLLFTDRWTSLLFTPPRAQIPTGRYSRRTGLGSLVFADGTASGLQQSEVTLPQLLRKHTPSYTNAAVGKWLLAPSNDRANWDHALGDADSGNGPWFDLWAGSLFNLPTGPGVGYDPWQKAFAASIDPLRDECDERSRTPCQVLLDECTSSAPSPGEYATVDTIDDAVQLVGTLPEPWFLYVAFNAPIVHRPSPRCG